jgi:antitoxin MazE
MRSKLVAIGNSRGLRIPKSIREEARLEDDVDLHVENGKLIVTPTKRHRPRQGWEQAVLDDIAHRGKEEPDSDWLGVVNSWDDKGWQ